ncbi:hypothetical protein [Butyrivibrio sp. FCS014]|uniref:hypothetical protein n=1 Tax=Butyrivibrio sp. FCS014 TaxID=1408304 RepID=UPI000467948A
MYEKRVGDLSWKPNVTIKGTKSGIILVLDPSVPFNDLKQKVAEKFAGSILLFLGKHDMGLIFRGRFLSDVEADGDS